MTRRVFDVRQTHGILWRPENRIEQSSDRLGWSSIYVSQQYEQPFDDSYEPVKDHLVILHLDGGTAAARHDGAHADATGRRVLHAGGNGFLGAAAGAFTQHTFLRAG